MAEAWLLGQEPYLSSREMGQSVDEVEKLIKRHEAFEKSAATWEERFSALERLTTVSRRNTTGSSETRFDFVRLILCVCVSAGAAGGEEAAGGRGEDEEAADSRAAGGGAGGGSAAEVKHLHHSSLWWTREEVQLRLNKREVTSCVSLSLCSGVITQNGLPSDQDSPRVSATPEI